MRITLFGAAFDPPHLGHQAIATSLLLNKQTDAVWIVPVKEHPFGKRLVEEEHRLAMGQLLAESIRSAVRAEKMSLSAEQLRVETYELEQSGASYTFKTLIALSKKHPEHQFSFVIGSDNLKTFDKWDKYQEMLSRFPFFVYPRHGYPFEPLYQGMIPLREMEEVRVSSTLIRERVVNELSITDLVTPEVESYIRQHTLYSATDNIE